MKQIRISFFETNLSKFGDFHYQQRLNNFEVDIWSSKLNTSLIEWTSQEYDLIYNVENWIY